MKFNLAAWCIKHKQVVYFFMALITISGIYSFNALGRSEDPKFVIRQMVISCAWPGATADEMEQHVTSKIEKAVQSLPDLDYITSYSRPGTCVVNVIIKEQVKNADVRSHWLEARNYVHDHLSDLPSDIYGPYFNDRFDDVYGNIYALTSDSFTYEEMRIQAEELKRQFYTVKDVRKVELIGEQPEKIYIYMSNDKLAKLGLSLTAVESAIAGETSVTPAGNADINGDSVYMRLTGLPNSTDNIRNILLNSNGKTFRLGDIAEVKREYPDPPENKMYVDGKPAIGIAISMQDNGNNIELGQNLSKMVTRMKKELPLGFEMHQVSNQPEVVKQSIDEFTESLWEAIVIVLVTSLFTLSRRSGYVISVCIPMVLMGALTAMYISGIELHKVSLGALIVSLGMLVDDALCVVEQIEVKMSQGWDPSKAASYAFEIYGSTLLLGTMITCTSFVPIALSNSNISEFAGSLCPVITMTLMFSWLVASTVAPTLGHAWIKPTALEEVSYDTGFYKAFRKTLNWCLYHRKTVMIAAVLIFVGSIGLLKLIKHEFFPASVRPEIVVEMNLPEGSGIKDSDKEAQKLMSFLLDDKDLDHVTAYVGKSSPRFVLVAHQEQPRENYAQVVVVAKNLEGRKRLETKIKDVMKKEMPNVVGDAQSLPLGPPSPYPVMFRVSAPTVDQVREYAAKVQQVVAANPNVTMTLYDWMEKANAVQVKIDNDKLKQMGLTRKVVANSLYANLNGYTVSEYYERDRAIDVIFRLDKSDRKSLDEIQNISIPTSSGAVPLSQVAEISYQSENNMIWRRDLQPTITVNADVGGGATGNDVAEQVWSQLKDMRENLPTGVKIEIGGPEESSIKALGYLMNPMPVVFVIMLILMMLQIQDMRKMFCVLCTAPLGIAGIALGLLLFNAPMGIMAEIGSFALVGTIIRNAMLIMDQIHMHMDDGKDPRTAVVESAIVRFRPIMLAALTTIFGLIPMFASPFWNAMAIAMACGLTGATALTLLFFPTLYAIVFKIPNEKTTEAPQA